MNTEDIKKEYAMALREKFSHTSRPYEDIAEWALNDFIADYIVKKLALYNVVKSLKDKKLKDLVNLAKSELSNENKMKVMKIQTEQDKRYIKLLKIIVDLQNL